MPDRATQPALRRQGTQAARLSERYDIAVLATGELLKANVDEGTALSRQAPACLTMGDGGGRPADRDGAG